MVYPEIPFCTSVDDMDVDFKFLTTVDFQTVFGDLLLIKFEWFGF
jgi:hypothetical protein